MSIEYPGVEKVAERLARLRLLESNRERNDAEEAELAGLREVVWDHDLPRLAQLADVVAALDSASETGLLSTLAGQATSAGELAGEPNRSSAPGPAGP